MPELPEVEIVKQSLVKNIKKKRIIKVLVRNRKLRFKLPLNFEDFLKNQTIIKVTRFSKYLILHFFNKTFCLIHLGMSGTIHVIKDNKVNIFTNTSFYNSSTLPQKHNHVEIHFKRLKLIYNDPRRFGFFKLILNRKELIYKLKNLGPEPFSKSFNLNYVCSYFNNKKKNIKSFLIDQKFVSGIGNIYASEILFLSKIKPTKKAIKLSKKECHRIIYFSNKVLIKAIKKGGSSIRNFKSLSGKDGLFQKEFNVYGREDLNCLKKGCNGKVKKIFITNRSTFFCNKCQK